MTQTNVSKLAPGIASLIQLCSKTLLVCYRCRGQNSDFEIDISTFITELESLSDAAETLTALLEECQDDEPLRKAQFPGKEASSAPYALAICYVCLNGCNAVLQELAQHFEPFAKSRSKATQKWPLESTEITSFIQLIQENKFTLESVTSVFQAALDKSEERGPAQTDVLRWYNTSDPERNHKLSKQSHEPNTGTWIFGHEGFQKWKSSTGEALWLHGIPGAGKTILCSTIIDHMQHEFDLDQAGQPNHQVVYYYFDFSDNNKQTLASFLRSIIFQLISIHNGPSDAAQALYDSQKGSARESSIEELLEVCTAELTRSPKTFLIVDALDESSIDERSTFMKQFLGKVLKLGISVLITSRKEPDIEKELRDVASQIVCLEAALVDEDVRVHVQSAIDNDPTLSSLRPALQKEILDEVVNGASGMFRWAVCQLEKLKKCLTPAMIRQELKEMPKTLDETYDRILSAVPPAHRVFVQSALHWLSFSTRPLLLEELAEAAVLRPESNHFDPESSRFLDSSMILDLCGVLVKSSQLNPRKDRAQWLDDKGQVETRGTQNFSNRREIIIVSMSHYTVKEYIMSSRLNSSSILSSYYASTTLTNSFLARACLFYLLEFNRGKVASRLDFEENPLLEYSACHWMQHWKLAGGKDCDVSLRRVCERFFSAEARNVYTNWLNVWNPDNKYEEWLSTANFGPIKVSADLFQQPLYWAAFLGDTNLVKLLVDQGADTTAQEGYFESAFGAAAFFGHLEVIEYFLEHGLDPNMQGTRFGSLLQVAVAGGSKPGVARLIQAGADVNARGGKLWQTALIAAASKQFDDIVTLLLENQADLKIGVQPGSSALYCAAQAGDVKLAMILLGAGADANGSGGDTDALPLFAAVQSGSLPLVRLLIRKGADVNKAMETEDSTYPLIEAVGKHHSHLVSVLLEAGADPNLSGRRGKTALEECIWKGDITMFNLLVDSGADLNACSYAQENCFQRAIQCRAFDKAKILMDKGADLGEAVVGAVASYEDAPWILEALLDRGANLDIFSDFSGTSVSTALHVSMLKYWGNDDAARILLEKGVYVNAIDQRNGTTPLCLAIEEGNVAMAQKLIEHGADFRRAVSHSPFELSIKYACEDGGTLEMADKLLELGIGINCDTENAPYYPLHTENMDVLRYLVEKGINLNRVLSPEGRFTRGIWGRRRATPIQKTAQQGSTVMLQALLDFGADINFVPESAEATILYGLRSKDKQIVELLLENGVAVDDSITSGSSIICTAIANDLAEMVPVLLEKGADPNGNEGGQSPLAAAFASGDRDLMQVLSSKGAHFLETDSQVAVEVINKDSADDLQFLLQNGLDPNVKSKSGSALEAAIKKTETTWINMLLDAGARLDGEQLQGSLGEVCKAGYLEMAALLLDRGSGFDLSAALAVAVEVPNNLAVIDFLFERGAEIHFGQGECFNAVARGGCQKVFARLLEQPMDTSQRTEYLGRALQTAVSYANLGLCKWLLDVQGADVNHTGLPYGSPLRACLSSAYYRDNNQLLIFETLIEHGANVNPPAVERPKGFEGWKKLMGGKVDHSTTFAPPLSLAIAAKSWISGSGLQPLAKKLLDLGADVNGAGGEYHAPLQAAAYLFPSMLPRLLDAGADVNAIGGRFGTALHAAAWNKDMESVKLLLARGADVRISAGKYGSVIQAAAKGDHYDRKIGQRTKEMMDLLLEAGADVHAQDGNYGSAVQMAAVSGNIAALEWLVAHGADIRVKGGRRGNVYRAALKNLNNNKAVNWHVVSWLEQHYGRDGWD